VKADRVLAACLIAAGSLAGGSTSLAVNDPPFVRISPADVHWQDLPGGHGDVARAVPLKPGSVMFHPAKVHR